MRSPFRIGLVLASAAVLALLVLWRTSHDRTGAIEAYRMASQLTATNQAKTLAEAFDKIYTNIRTISHLPGVQNIDRHGQNLGADGHATIQQIYNNLASSVEVSEVYIVPADLDYKAIDAVTGKPQAPILMYDELIVGAGTAKQADSATMSPVAADPNLPEEVETAEYDLLHEQIGFLRDKYGDRSTIKGLDVPMVSGREVITCDNTEFVKTRLDADRIGQVFSVPFYGPDGKLKGTVSAIIRSNAWRRLLPPSNAALVSPIHNVFISSTDPGSIRTSEEDARQGQTDRSLLFSAAIPIQSADKSADWIMWTGLPDSAFEGSAEMLSISQFRWLALAVILAAAVAAIAMMAYGERSAQRLTAEKARLATELDQRTEDIRSTTTEESEKANKSWRKTQLQQISSRFELTVQHGVAALSSTSDRLSAIASNSAEFASATSEESEVIRKTSDAAKLAAVEIASAANQVSEAIEEISRQTGLSNLSISSAIDQATVATDSVLAVDARCQDISGAVAQINRIASSINLLALNATIEAARAGEAGRGFSVVATEVKQLSSQVARVSEDITERVSEITLAAQKSIGHVDETLGSLRSIQQTSVAVSGSLEEQRAAADQIANGIEQTAKSVQQIALQMSALARGSQAASQSAESVLKSAQDLKELSVMIGTGTAEFVTAIKAA
jgi:methyl-accepting chemotaxis protein